MDLNHLRSFYYAAKHLSISKAAHEVGVNQPALSKHIMALEKELSCHLLDRLSRKGLVLTEKGQILFDSAKKIMMEADNANQTLTESNSKTPTGTLRLAMTVGVLTTIIMEFAPDFLKLHPQIKLSMIGHEDLDLNTWEADAAIRPFVSNNPDLIQIPLIQFTFKLYASEKYLAEYGTPKTPEDLDHHRLIAFARDIRSGFGDANWMLSLGRNKQLPREPYFEANSALVLKRAALADLGIASLTDGGSYLKDAASLVNVLPEFHGDTVSLCYVYPKIKKYSPKVIAFGEHISKVFDS